MDACDFLSLEKPVLQGAMGGVARQDLVVAVSEAGGLGTLSYLPPAFFESELRCIEERLEGKTFAANLLMPLISRLHVEACLKSSVQVVTLFYGFDQAIVSALKDAGKLVLFQIGSLEEAELVLSAGADGVIVQGYEAGGHLRGEERLAELLPKVRTCFPDALICGAGGIHNKDTAEVCRSSGADAVCAGTRFLASPEASAHPEFKRRLVTATETIVTDLFGVGWRDLHRVIPNSAVKKWCARDSSDHAFAPMTDAAEKLVSGLSDAVDRAAILMRQSLEQPIYTPSSLTPELEATMIEYVALYAGECVQNIHELQPVPKSVELLS
ncbi:MAG: 2-nitropropane dioxygenase [Ponticaulis sp.]|nr:2-nitropropane dioxygenase [Ponticaulis sp.]